MTTFERRIERARELLIEQGYGEFSEGELDANDIALDFAAQTLASCWPIFKLWQAKGIELDEP